MQSQQSIEFAWQCTKCLWERERRGDGERPDEQVGGKSGLNLYPSEAVYLVRCNTKGT